MTIKHTKDENLRKAVTAHSGRNWKAIAKTAFDERKTDVQCLHRFAFCEPVFSSKWFLVTLLLDGKKYWTPTWLKDLGQRRLLNTFDADTYILVAGGCDGY